MQTSKAIHRLTLLSLLLPPLLGVATIQAAPKAKAKAKPVAKTSIANTPLINLTDPTENAFTVGMPKGWRNQAYMVRTYEIARPVLTSLSPDGQTVLFCGDPRAMTYYLPTPENQQIAQFGLLNPLTKISDLAPAQTYFQWYVKEKFGRLPGFRLAGVGPNPKLMVYMKRGAARNHINPYLDCAKVSFSYQEKGKTLRSVLNGNIMAMGSIWLVSVSGVSTPGDPEPYNDLLMRSTDSYRTNKRWQEQQNQLHEQRMAMLRQDAQNNQVAFNASNKAHEMRMNAIKDAGNASMKSWYEKQATSDASHRNFMNYITSENTVVVGGKAFQVDNSHQRYFVNKHDNTYIGTSNSTSLDDLRQMGINPNDYQMAKIKR